MIANSNTVNVVRTLVNKANDYNDRMLAKVKYSSISEAIEASGMNWTPTMEGIQTQSGHQFGDEYRALVGPNGPLGIVGSSYSPMGYGQFFNRLTPLLDCGGKIVSARQHNNGLAGTMEFYFPELISEPVKGTTIGWKVVASTGHAGKFTHSIELVPTVVRCENGMIACGNAELSIKARHTENAELKLSGNISQRMADIIGRTNRKIRALETMTISRDKAREYMIDVLKIPHNGEYADLSTRGSNILSEVMSNLQSRQSVVSELLAGYEVTQSKNTSILDSILSKYDGGGIGHNSTEGHTAWQALNAVTEYATHNRGKDDEREFSNLLGSNRELIERATTTAYAMVS